MPGGPRSRAGPDGSLARSAPPAARGRRRPALGSRVGAGAPAGERRRRGGHGPVRVDQRPPGDQRDPRDPAAWGARLRRRGQGRAPAPGALAAEAARGSRGRGWHRHRHRHRDRPAARPRASAPRVATLARPETPGPPTRVASRRSCEAPPTAPPRPAPPPRPACSPVRSGCNASVRARPFGLLLSLCTPVTPIATCKPWAGGALGYESQGPPLRGSSAGGTFGARGSLVCRACWS